MNFPDLEICEPLASEFPNSEFVWIQYVCNNNKCSKVTVSRDSFKAYMPYTDHKGNWLEQKLLSSSPSCEELGEWLWNKNSMVVRLSRTPQFWRVHSPVFDDIIEIHGENETQARAEAVKIILEKE